MILTYYENIDLGSASVNSSIVSQYRIIYTDLKVHNCIMFVPRFPEIPEMLYFPTPNSVFKKTAFWNAVVTYVQLFEDISKYIYHDVN